MQTQEEFNKFALNHIENHLRRFLETFIVKHKLYNDPHFINMNDYGLINLNGAYFIKLNATDKELFLTIKTRLDIIKECKSKNIFPPVEHRKWVTEILNMD